MPLSQRVCFKTRLQRQNCLQIPKLVRWQYKLEPSEILKVTVTIEGFLGVREIFLSRRIRMGGYVFQT